VILVDSNIPMYLVGGEHPLKARARQLAGIPGIRRLE
jgi:predicted nucleic acid-binding protein